MNTAHTGRAADSKGATMNKTSWIERARRLGPELAEYAARHDEDGTFAVESLTSLKEDGLYRAIVPADLGGGGAGMRDICEVIRELAHYCGSTALAFSMHTHLVAATRWKYEQGQPGEALLRKVVDNGLVLISTGAGDWLESNGTMEKVDGGYRYTSKKPFASGSPIGDVMITSGRYEHPEKGPMVLHFSLPFSTEGVRRGDDWDTHGMRGSGSNTVHIDGAFIPDASIALERARGPWHPAFNVVSTVALPIFMSAYLGVAERACELALQSARPRRDDVNVQYLAGELGNELFVARTAWNAIVDNMAELDFKPTIERACVATEGKTVLAEACIRTVSKAMELAGGGAFFRKSGIERLMRDVRGAQYHPLQAKRQHVFTGRAALGLEPM